MRKDEAVGNKKKKASLFTCDLIILSLYIKKTGYGGAFFPYALLNVSQIPQHTSQPGRPRFVQWLLSSQHGIRKVSC
jgi:hypothetical protein